MYLQYRKNKNKYELIQQNNRPDEDNADILAGKYDNSEVELTREQRLGMIFIDWQEGDILIVAPQPLKYPKLDTEKQTLIEMTREEICTSGDFTVLTDGEKFEDGQIVTVEKPNSKYLNYSWNRESFSWELITTKEELMLKRKDLIMQYKELKTEIETLEEFSEEFESDNTVELLKTKMRLIKQEINDLLAVIKKLK